MITRVRRARLLSVLIVLALVSACTSVGTTSKPSSTGSAASKTATPAPGVKGIARTVTQEQLTAKLSAAGVRVYAEAGDDEPVPSVAAPKALALTAWQVRNMTRQLNDGRGYSGAQLDELTAIEGTVPFSIVVAAYVNSGKTAGAELSRELMGGQDFRGQARALVYPATVLALLAADESGAAPRNGAAPRDARLRQLVGAAADTVGVCGKLANFIDQTLLDVTNALKVDASGGGVLASIWDTVIDIAAYLAKKALAALTAPVVAIVHGALAVVGTLSLFAGLLLPWKLDIDEDEPVANFGVEPDPGTPVTVTAHVDTDAGFKWPTDVAECASLAGVTLPDPTSAKGSPVTFTTKGLDGLATVGKTDDEIGVDNSASLHLTTGTETKKDATQGAPLVETYTVAVKVERTQIKDVLKFLTGLITRQLPNLVAKVMKPVLDYLTEPIRAKLSKLIPVDGQVHGATIVHHGPAKDEPTSPASADTCAGLADGTIPDGTWTGPIKIVVVGSGKGALVRTYSQIDDGGAMTVTVQDGKVTQGTWAVKFVSVGEFINGGAAGRLYLVGQIAGTVKGSAARPTLPGNWNFKAAVHLVSPVKTKLPIKAVGKDTEYMKIEQATCKAVSGTFIPSFNTKTVNAPSGGGVFSGTARWDGHRV